MKVNVFWRYNNSTWWTFSVWYSSSSESEPLILHPKFQTYTLDYLVDTNIDCNITDISDLICFSALTLIKPQTKSLKLSYNLTIEVPSLQIHNKNWTILFFITLTDLSSIIVGWTCVDTFCPGWKTDLRKSFRKTKDQRSSPNQTIPLHPFQSFEENVTDLSNTIVLLQDSINNQNTLFSERFSNLEKGFETQNKRMEQLDTLMTLASNSVV